MSGHNCPCPSQHVTFLHHTFDHIPCHFPSIYSDPFAPPSYAFLPRSQHPPPTTARRMTEPAPPQAAEQGANSHTPSSSSSSAALMPSPANMATSVMGKHRMAAAISYLNQQIQIIQDELHELETVGGVSTVCQELISNIDSVPDALLAETRGPADVGWDRWFQGAQSSRSRRRWI